MNIILNNTAESIEGNEISISQLLIIKNFIFKMLVIKVNDQVVKKQDYETTIVKDGDNVVSIDRVIVENFQTIPAEIVLKEAKSIQILRGKEKMDILIPPTIMKELVKHNKNMQSFIDVRYPAVVDSVLKSAVFTEGTLLKGDTLIGINSNYFGYFHELVELRQKYKDSIVTVSALRGKDTVRIRALMKDGMIGLGMELPNKMFTTVVKKYSFFESIPIGTKRCKETLDRYLIGLKQIFTGKVNANDSLGSVISIGNTFPSIWDWERFWTLTGIFSIILAFMNILPIPALDGGHALFTLFEMLTGKKPSDKFMEYAQIVGMVLLLSLMAYALGLDFWRLIK